MKTTRDVSEVLDINPYALDREWVEQPALFHVWASKLSNARSKHEESLREIDIVVAELDMDIRDNPKSYGIKKLSEKAIEKCIILQKEYMLAVKASHEAKRKMDSYNNMVRALEHKKKALEKLVELHITDYHSDPKANGEGGRSMREVEKKRVRNSITEQLNKRRGDDDD